MGAKSNPTPLEAIEQNFTKLREPLEVLGSESAVLLAASERAAIADFIISLPPAAYTIEVGLVTGKPGGLDFDIAHTYRIPEDVPAALELNDKLRKIEGLLYFGLLVAVLDRKTGAACRWARAFVPCQESTEMLERAALAQPNFLPSPTSPKKPKGGLKQ